MMNPPNENPRATPADPPLSGPSRSADAEASTRWSSAAGDAGSEIKIATSIPADPEQRWQRIRAALEDLNEGFEFAQNLGREVWDFAIEIDQMQQRGLRTNDLRWLIFKGWVIHGHELTERSSEQRRFTVGGPSRFDRTSCFILSQAGADLLKRRWMNILELPAAAPESGKELILPKWDEQRQELRVAQYVIKRFKVPAHTQGVILSAFEEESWPARIDDPLPGHPELDRKRRLHNTINALNRNQVHSLIRFLGDGRGQGVRWEFQPRTQFANSG
jgi:hypothetical protein